MKDISKVWMDQPEAHDYPAALDYLTLISGPKRASAMVARLRRAKIIRRKAKDILRASALHVLPDDNPHVARDLKKVRKGERLSPVLLVRGDGRRGTPLVIADGFHRVCASWYIDEDALIPCRMTNWS